MPETLLSNPWKKATTNRPWQENLLARFNRPLPGVRRKPKEPVRCSTLAGYKLCVDRIPITTGPFQNPVGCYKTSEGSATPFIVRGETGRFSLKIYLLCGGGESLQKPPYRLSHSGLVSTHPHPCGTWNPPGQTQKSKYPRKNNKLKGSLIDNFCVSAANLVIKVQ